jgi:hypothetical protein
MHHDLIGRQTTIQSRLLTLPLLPRPAQSKDTAKHFLSTRISCFLFHRSPLISPPNGLVVQNKEDSQHSNIRQSTLSLNRWPRSAMQVIHLSSVPRCTNSSIRILGIALGSGTSSIIFTMCDDPFMAYSYFLSSSDRFVGLGQFILSGLPWS